MPIVEFALENARAINLRKERLKRQVVTLKMCVQCLLLYNSQDPVQIKKKHSTTY